MEVNRSQSIIPTRKRHSEAWAARPKQAAPENAWHIAVLAWHCMHFNIFSVLGILNAML